MPEQSIVAKRQSDALKLEALRPYFNSRQGAKASRPPSWWPKKLGLSVHTVKSWLSDNANAEILDEIVPLWPHRLVVPVTPDEVPLGRYELPGGCRMLEAQRNQKRRSLFDAQDAIDQQREALSGQIEHRLRQAANIEELFS